jgi:hypothetical protein
MLSIGVGPGIGDGDEPAIVTVEECQDGPERVLGPKLLNETVAGQE